ncbi:MAG TPA: phosphoglycerate kinase [Candidatus Woesearchaeota archaeon]|nr:phosphoglycerate kinase [Candidatus Woesearchaeota archaeon]
MDSITNNEKYRKFLPTKKDIFQKRVILRLDLNVPLYDAKISDKYRILSAVKSIKFILGYRPQQIIILSHLGDPKGFDMNLSLKPVYKELSKILKKEIKKDIAFKNIEELEKKLSQKCNEKEFEIILLENTRFYEGETKNDKHFSQRLLGLGNVFVNDGFGVMHRRHCSNYGIAEFMPSFIGPLCLDELENLDFSKSKKPFLVLLGGKKLSTKIPVIKALLKKADSIFLGGAMVFTFYKAMGLEIGKSLYEKELINEAKYLLRNKNIILPKDILCSKSIEKPINTEIKNFNLLGIDDYGVDIGTKSITELKAIINISKTIFWNGPFGIFEIKDFSKSTKGLLGILKESKAKIIAGGGDSVMAINKFKATNCFDFISTGGGASLEFIAKETLDYLELLKKKNKT